MVRPIRIARRPDVAAKYFYIANGLQGLASGAPLARRKTIEVAAFAIAIVRFRVREMISAHEHALVFAVLHVGMIVAVLERRPLGRFGDGKSDAGVVDRTPSDATVVVGNVDASAFGRRIISGKGQ